MNRLALSENMRRLRNADNRDPLEAAFWAFASLSEADKAAMAERWNAVQAQRVNGSRLKFTPAEK